MQTRFQILGLGRATPHIWRSRSRDFWADPASRRLFVHTDGRLSTVFRDLSTKQGKSGIPYLICKALNVGEPPPDCLTTALRAFFTSKLLQMRLAYAAPRQSGLADPKYCVPLRLHRQSNIRICLGGGRSGFHSMFPLKISRFWGD